MAWSSSGEGSCDTCSLVLFIVCMYFYNNNNYPRLYFRVVMVLALFALSLSTNIVQTSIHALVRYFSQFCDIVVCFILVLYEFVCTVKLTGAVAF